MLLNFHRSVSSALLVALLLFAPSLRADELDDQYLRILSVVGQAEGFQEAGKNEEAKARYQAAQKHLLEIKKADPTWKAAMVAHRLTDVNAKLAALSAPPSVKDSVGKETSGTTDVRSSQESATPVLKLLDAGAEPRRAVRLTPKAGDGQKFELTMNMSMETSMAGSQMPAMNMPAIKLPIDVSIESVSADGEINYKTTVGEVNIASSEAPGVGEMMQSMFGSMKGLASSVIMSSRGIIKSTDMKLPADATPQLRQSAEQLKESLAEIVAPFPEEPIGVGAKWEMKQVRKSQGMAIKQTSAYELVALEGNRAEVKLTILQSAANQKISNPAMPGLKMDLDKMEGAGTGRTTYDLTQPMPVSSEISSGTDIKMGMNVGGQKQAMEMKSTNKLRLESR